ncbi:hypothetical protein CTI14_49885, partial [Methylobacterium radiotolerans]
MGYTREAAARYSFLLAIPAVFGSGLYQLFKSLKGGFDGGPYGLGETAVATVVAFVVGYVIIGWFLKYVSHNSYRLFVWYRIGLGAALYVLLGWGTPARPRRGTPSCSRSLPCSAPASTSSSSPS